MINVASVLLKKVVLLLKRQINLIAFLNHVLVPILNQTLYETIVGNIVI